MGLRARGPVVDRGDAGGAATSPTPAPRPPLGPRPMLSGARRRVVMWRAARRGAPCREATGSAGA